MSIVLAYVTAIQKLTFDNLCASLLTWYKAAIEDTLLSPSVKVIDPLLLIPGKYHVIFSLRFAEPKALIAFLSRGALESVPSSEMTILKRGLGPSHQTQSHLKKGQKKASCP